MYLMTDLPGRGYFCHRVVDEKEVGCLSWVLSPSLAKSKV